MRTMTVEGELTPLGPPRLVAGAVPSGGAATHCNAELFSKSGVRYGN